MTSIRRSPLSSIENIDGGTSSEGIELREVTTPLLPTDFQTPHPSEDSHEIDETTPFTFDDDNNLEHSGNETNRNVDVEVSIRERRRSSLSNRATTRENRDIRQITRNFWNDLFPSDNRSAWRLPISIFILFIIIILIVFVFIVVGYTTIEYDEFGVTRNLITGIMNLKHPYSTGVHLILPWKTMVKFDKTARYLNFNNLAVFTTDQASVILDVTVVYRIRPHQIEPIWLNFGDKHEYILQLVAENVFRNYGNQFSIYDYRARREHVQNRLSHQIQQTLSGDCCPICCQEQTCWKTIEYFCLTLSHCKNSSEKCSNGYFVDIDAVYIFKVALAEQIVRRLYALVLRPIYTEIAESQEQAALVWIETERQRNEFLNKAREVLMSALAKSELIQEKARISLDNLLLKETSSSEQKLFNQLNIQNTPEKFSAAFLLELNHLINVTKTVDMDSLVTQCDKTTKTQKTNDLFDFVPSSNVFDLSEFLSLLEN